MAQPRNGKKSGDEKKKIVKNGKLQKRGIQKRGVKAPEPQLEIEFIPDPNFDDEDFPDD